VFEDEVGLYLILLWEEEVLAKPRKIELLYSMTRLSRSTIAGIDRSSFAGGYEA
jgi:hypothetical protein